LSRNDRQLNLINDDVEQDAQTIQFDYPFLLAMMIKSINTTIDGRS